MTFSDFISFISCVAALAAVYYSYQSICLTMKSAHDDFNNKRPLLSIEENSQNILDTEIEFNTKIKNYGHRTAKSIKFESLLILKENNDYYAQSTDDFDIIELVPQAWTSFYVYKFPKEKSEYLKYFVIKVLYNESIVDQVYKDSFVRIWNGKSFSIPSIQQDLNVRSIDVVKKFLDI